ncbi:hypothetical protein ACFT7S_07020 [Streptomyces sp. NPDC057136]|uniref:hypothetical protein n=1 Tax=Streptomyces sp. NPDC057136 TaxID=3346029 RepID=UPI0036431F5D
MTTRQRRHHRRGRRMSARQVAACAAAVAAAITGGICTIQATKADSKPTQQERECTRILDRIENVEREYADYLAADTIPSECVPEALERGLLDEEQR